MKIGIFGKHREYSRYEYRYTQTEFEKACKEIGVELARKGHTVIVYNDSPGTADYYIAKSIIETAGNMWDSYPLIEVNTKKSRDELAFEAYAREFPQLIHYHPQEHDWSEAAHLISVRNSDVIMTIGGGRKTHLAGIAALVARKRLIPIASFGGASEDLYKQVTASGEFSNSADFKRLNQPWSSFVKNSVFNLIGADKPPRIFLGYCSLAKSVAAEINLFLVSELGMSVCNYAMDFMAGETILEQIEKESRECNCGIFLFTKDDPLIGENQIHAAPRDNVVFEAGYFMHAFGKEKTLIILEEGAKMPADLGSNIYINLKNRSDITTIHTQLRKVLKERLDRS